VQAAEKLAECLGSHAPFGAEHKQGGYDEADEPGTACLCFPQRRLRVAIAAIHGLKMAMHAAFGKPGAIRQAPDALFAMLTNRLENDNAFGPQSHGVGPCSEGWLKSWLKSALQSTRSTADCPALRRYLQLANENQLAAQIVANNASIQTLTENIKQNTKKIEEINSKKSILAYTGRPLERSVKKVCKELGLPIGGIEVYEEDGTLELDGNSIPVEIKGHKGAITEEDARQVLSRGNKAKVKDGIPVKGILFGNPYSETPLDKRGADFHYNVIEAAKPWGICLVGTRVLFKYLKEYQTYGKTLLPEKILKTVGILEFEPVPQ
jgi:hypothetical protein